MDKQHRPLRSETAERTLIEARRFRKNEQDVPNQGIEAGQSDSDGAH